MNMHARSMLCVATFAAVDISPTALALVMLQDQKWEAIKPIRKVPRLGGGRHVFMKHFLPSLLLWQVL